MMRPWLLVLAACAKPGPSAVDPDAPVDTALAVAHPFGTHGGYVTTGVIFPSNHTQAELDAATTAYYDVWKAKYLVPGCAAGQYRIVSTPATTAYTVSEGHGYGMLIAAIMDGHDPDAHAI